jgi:hypothetical protein
VETPEDAAFESVLDLFRTDEDPGAGEALENILEEQE